MLANAQQYLSYSLMYLSSAMNSDSEVNAHANCDFNLYIMHISRPLACRETHCPPGRPDHAGLRCQNQQDRQEL